MKNRLNMVMLKGENRKEEKKLKKFSSKELLLKMFILIVQTRKWWLLPFLFILALLSIFFSISGNHSILPAIYALF